MSALCTLVLLIELTPDIASRLVYQGPLPGEFRGICPAVVRLDKQGPDFLFLEGESSLGAFTLNKGRLLRAGEVPLGSLPHGWEVARRWILHDADGDSLPEALVAHGAEIREFDWRDSAFGMVGSPRLPATRLSSEWWIVDFVFGDIDQDGQEELFVVAYDHRPAGEHDFPESAVLFVCRPQGDSLRVLWDDGGKFALAECASGVVPPSDLLGVFDFRNDGHYALLHEGVESSVGPFTYTPYFWKDGGLIEGESFTLQGLEFADSVPESERFWSAMDMVPFVENGRTKLEISVLDSTFYATGNFHIQVVELTTGNWVVSARTIPSSSGYEGGEYVVKVKMDPDGMGKGALKLFSSETGKPRFEFYR